VRQLRQRLMCGHCSSAGFAACVPPAQVVAGTVNASELQEGLWCPSDTGRAPSLAGCTSFQALSEVCNKAPSSTDNWQLYTQMAAVHTCPEAAGLDLSPACPGRHLMCTWQGRTIQKQVAGSRSHSDKSCCLITATVPDCGGLACCTAVEQARLSSALVAGSLVERIRSIGSVMRTRRPAESRARWPRASSALRLRLSARRAASDDLQRSRADAGGASRRRAATRAAARRLWRLPLARCSGA
jgi:hypothetical protein